MAKPSVGPGDMFFKTGHPGIVWTVQRLKQDVSPAHVILSRLGDPATLITVSVAALANPQYFRRSAAVADVLPREPEGH